MSNSEIAAHTYLKAWRAKMGLSLEQVANILSMKHSTLSRWENGKVDLSLTDLRRLSAAYGISTTQLLMPPEKADIVGKLDRAMRVIDSLDSAEAENWLSLGEKAAGVK
ncbi:helix-turn-helix domain-containing protein [Acetobacter tropicalis]|uniref:helix-turn-helix domain-containing protein n=1 Tax=Acetobacter TaxID=434 RepID=UPI001EDC18DB|nr:helix-turn-helix transcriptional regulator [Acetobacter senegalensis]MCG4256896.1 helix-turn-helix domain-containing protein [Acetobacter senegalensis]MCG4266966.1 helix-turn-helix domain-containing protein [Acetobacter senegalensis]